ncbi:MAG: hypothetical protein KJI69_03635 [Patescibacteria group bacterium]|nr:hypothetical protein [Patescibacteria group bacterium]
MSKDPNCSVCGYVFKPEDGCYNFPDGIKCDDCGDKDQRTVRWVHKNEKNVTMKPEKITIKNHKIDLKLLLEYADEVEETRRALEFSYARKNPLRIQKSLEKRKVLHAKIMKSIRIKYQSKESFAITEAINQWIEKTKPQESRN